MNIVQNNSAGDQQKPTSISVLLRNAFLLGMLVWLLLASAYQGAISPMGGITGVDFRIFYGAAERLNKGLTLYQTDHDLYVYSPLLALLLRPLAHLTYEKALKIWFFVSAVSLLLSVLFYACATRLTLRDVGPLGLMLLVSFRFWPTTMNFGLGQANFVLLALLAGMYWADSRKKMVYFALFLATAALVKVWILGFVLYLLLQRQWKPALLSIGGYAAALIVLFSVVGWREWPLFLKAATAGARQINNYQVRQSIVGFADLHFHANPFIQPLVSSRILFGLFMLVCVTAVGAMLICLWFNAPNNSLYRNRLCFGLVIVSVLLLLPPFEDEYIVYCLPLLWTLLLPPSTGVERRLSWPLPFCILIYLALSRGWPVYPPIAALYQHGLPSLLVSLDFVGVSALWLLTVFTLRSQNSSRQIQEWEP